MALKRFIDDIATEVIEVKLLSALSTLFTPIIAYDMPEDLITQIAGESEESQSLREQLSKKLWILKKGSDTCRRFVGIRGPGKRITPLFALLLSLPEPSNELETTLEQVQVQLSPSSCSSIEQLDQAVAIDSESDDEKSCPPSPILLPSSSKVEYALEHPAQPEEHLVAPSVGKGGKKKKKKKSVSKLQSPTDLPSELPMI